MIEANDATAVNLPNEGEKAYDWYRTAYTKRIDSVLTTLGLEPFGSDGLNRMIAVQERAFLDEGFEGEDIKRASFLGVIGSAVREKGEGEAWTMMLSFAKSAYDDLSKLEVSGVAPGPIPKI